MVARLLAIAAALASVQVSGHEAEQLTLRCGLNCYGDGAKAIALPGATGDGDSMHVEGVSHEACREYCRMTDGCEGVLFLKEPNPTACYGKTDIHTSKCQKSDGYVTEVLTGQPWGKCALLGDPHVLTFDNQHGGSTLDKFEPGEYYIAKSRELMVHGRFGYTERFPTAASTVGIAIGGPLIGGHKLVVEYVGPAKGVEGFQAFWDGERILESFPSEYKSEDGMVHAMLDNMDPSSFHTDARHTIGGESGSLPSYLIELAPDFKVYILIGPDSCNIIIEAKKIPGGQDGYCGNFNCDADDDTMDSLKERGADLEIPSGESLFKSGPPPPYPEMEEPKEPTPTLDDCDEALRARAEKACEGNEPCIFDACASGTVKYVDEELEVQKIEEEITHGKDSLTAPFDCEAGFANWERGWSDGKKEWCCKNAGKGCPKSDCPSCTSPAVPGLVCDLNCYGEGAEEVFLQGSAGNGHNGGIPGLSMATCRDYCFGTDGCEGFTYTNASTPSMCFGKKNIHASRCQPGNGYVTEVVTVMPFGTCAAFGDPHILTFDRHHHGPTLDVFKPGIFWLVKSKGLSIQARYGYSKRFPDKSSMVGIAVSGPLIGGHTLVVEYQGPAEWQDGFFASWDGMRILTTYPSSYAAPDKVLSGKLEPLDPDHFHNDARHTIGGVPGAGRMASYLFELVPDIQIYCLLGPDNMNVVLTMRKLTDAQDGFCGNFNCVEADDDVEDLKQKGLAGAIPDMEDLFKGAPPPPPSELQKQPSKGSSGLEDCPLALLQQAEKKCAHAPTPDEFKNCKFDVCVAGSVEVATADVITSQLQATVKAPPSFDCSAGFANWERGWSANKKVWCCSNVGKGCVDTTPVPLTYDCLAGFANWQQGWSAAKKSWCCEHVGKGCITPSPVPGTYDCSAGFANWVAGWSVEKKAWCCHHVGKGCVAVPPGCSTSAAPPTAPPATASTTAPTVAPYDCVDGFADWRARWSAPKKAWCCAHNGRGCEPEPCPTSPAEPTSTTVPPTSTAVPPTNPIVRCDLNCYGEGAEAVLLPGAVGEGDDASVPGMSLKACRDLCFNTDTCESVMYNNASTPSRCYGKKDVHTSKCQPGNGYVTEILGEMPFGTCSFMGDPHIHSFDSPYGASVDQLRAGEFWAIRASELSVQMRFGMTKQFPNGASTTGIAIGGSLVRDHVLVAGYFGPEEGYAGFRVYWDGQEILKDYPSSYSSDDAVLVATHDAMDPTKYHREGRSTIGDYTADDLPSYLFQLMPSITVYMLLGTDSCNVIIKAKKLAGGQDGYCGNFNCDAEDDTMEEIEKRGVARKVFKSQSLFSSAPPAPDYQMESAGPPPSLEDCPSYLRIRAKALCKANGVGNSKSESDCIFDCCAAGSEERCKEIVQVDIASEAVKTSVERNVIAKFGQQLVALGHDQVHLGAILVFAASAAVLGMGVRRVTRRRNASGRYDRLFNHDEAEDSLHLDLEPSLEVRVTRASPSRGGGPSLFSFSPVAMLTAASHDDDGGSEDEALLGATAI